MLLRLVLVLRLRDGYVARPRDYANLIFAYVSKKVTGKGGIAHFPLRQPERVAFRSRRVKADPRSSDCPRICLYLAFRKPNRGC